MRHHPARERDGQPEKRAAEQVERVGTDEIGPEVGFPVPAPVSAAHGIMAHLVERNLLNIEISVKEKISLVKKDERNKKQESGTEPVEKGFFSVKAGCAALQAV